MNLALFKREMKHSWKLFLIFGLILTIYITMIISMYDPELADALEQFERLMPELMSAVGMTGANDTLGSFMSSYLYGMILLVFPMVFSVIRANGLIAKYVDHGSMVSLLAAPVRRIRIVITQYVVLVFGIFLLLAYCTVLEYAAAQWLFPDELILEELLRLNAGLFCLQVFLGSFCFMCSCIFSDTKYSMVFGAGIPVFMYVLQMLANMGGKLEKIKYMTCFSLFRPEPIMKADGAALMEAGILLLAGIVFSGISFSVFCSKDMSI